MVVLGMDLAMLSAAGLVWGMAEVVVSQQKGSWGGMSTLRWLFATSQLGQCQWELID